MQSPVGFSGRRFAFGSALLRLSFLQWWCMSPAFTAALPFSVLQFTPSLHALIPTPWKVLGLDLLFTFRCYFQATVSQTCQIQSITWGC
jgi:hypothetical protein